MNLQAHNSPRVLDNSIAKQKASSEKAIVQKIAVWKKGKKKPSFLLFIGRTVFDWPTKCDAALYVLLRKCNVLTGNNSITFCFF